MAPSVGCDKKPYSCSFSIPFCVFFRFSTGGGGWKQKKRKGTEVQKKKLGSTPPFFLSSLCLSLHLQRTKALRQIAVTAITHLPLLIFLSFSLGLSLFFRFFSAENPTQKDIRTGFINHETPVRFKHAIISIATAVVRLRFELQNIITASLN